MKVHIIIKSALFDIDAMTHINALDVGILLHVCQGIILRVI